MPIAFLVCGGVLVLMILALTGKAQAETAASTSSSGDNTGQSPPDTVSVSVPLAVTTGDDCMNPVQTDDNSISTDPGSWPSGDKIWDICRAIAMAEGYNVPASVPFTLNNPGDISDGANEFGSQQHSGSNVTTFPDAATGWNWLYQKISNHINGKSSTYPAVLTITAFAQKYAANWQNWKKNVGNQLGVNPDSTTFSEYVNT